jgi:hypothetical protein
MIAFAIPVRDIVGGEGNLLLVIDRTPSRPGLAPMKPGNGRKLGAELFAKREALKEADAEDKVGDGTAKVTPTSGRAKPAKATAKKAN